VLDFGCGTGWVVSGARSTGNPWKVGVDYSFASLQKGATMHPEITFVNADGVALPFADGSFDAVIGHVSLPYMDTRLALAEIHRVLVPGGSLLLTFHSFYYAMHNRLWRGLRRGNVKDVLFSLYMSVNGFLNHCSLPQFRSPWGQHRFETVNTPSGVCRTARSAGFINVSVSLCPEKIFFAARAAKPI
jgi:ubiquinone/menaquinone biosynthesis C-methylase UbiE